MHKQPLSLAKLRKVPKQFSWVDQRLVREHDMDALSHPACTLYLFLLTVADAQGLSYYSEPALCRRLSMSETTLHQARQTCTVSAANSTSPALWWPINTPSITSWPWRAPLRFLSRRLPK